MVEKTKFHIIAYAALGTGLSGGDNIFIELSRRWADKLHITIHTGKEGFLACSRRKLSSVTYHVCPSILTFGRYIERAIRSIILGLTWKDTNCIVYTSSDFFHDCIAGWIIKKRFSSVTWVASCYLVAPNPFWGYSPYSQGFAFRGFGFWLTQRFSLWLIKLADKVCVTSKPETKHFPNKEVIVVKGGVNIEDVNTYHKCYDAIFMGRFHPQKGVLELIDIWEMVIQKYPYAKLFMLGDGKLKPKVLRKVIEKKMVNNVDFINFLDGKEKAIALQSSRIILHPATFDSGGMSAAEGMAYGLPAVGFNLKTYDTYYPKGMLKATNNEGFALHILSLLTYPTLYERISREAKELIQEYWLWDKRAEELYKEIIYQ